MLAATTACTSPAGVIDDGARILTTSSGESPMQASISGEIAVLADDCLGVNTAEGGAVVVSWPQGSSLVDEGVGVELPDGRELRVGDGFEGGGGLVPSGEPEKEICPTTTEFWLLGEVAMPAGQ